MLRKTIHIVLLLCLVAVSNCYAQVTAPSWVVAPGTSQKEFNVSVGVIVNNDPLVVGDYIGVFVNKNGQEICVGFVEVEDLDSVQNIFANFNTDTVLSIPQQGDHVTFKYWSLAKQCAIDVTTNLGTSELELTSSPASNISGFFSSDVNSPYTYESQYTNEGQIISPDSVAAHTEGAKFREVSQALIIDSLTGEVDLNLVVDGTYEIEVTLGDMCLVNNRFIIDVVTPDQEKEEGVYFAPTSDDPKFRKLEIESNDGATIEIFDKSGRLIISSSETFSWDGKDKYGNELPADDYYIKVGDQMTIVTVLQ